MARLKQGHDAIVPSEAPVVNTLASRMDSTNICELAHSRGRNGRRNSASDEVHVPQHLKSQETMGGGSSRPTI